MIDRQEIISLSHEYTLSPGVIDKDYALGWLLYGIGRHPSLKDNWVFKGGTCLKKCYFETYRFSEDLDFTLRDQGHLNAEFLVRVFSEISESVYELSGVEYPVDTFKFDVYTNKRGMLSCEGKVGYRGPYPPGGEVPRIKLDLASDEKLVLAPVLRPVHHGYSDNPEGGFSVFCYAPGEVFAEKIRALGERLRPRDLYDVVNMYRNPAMRTNPAEVLHVLREKCQFKGIAAPSLESVREDPKLAELKAEWANMLAHQLPSLPPFDTYWEELVSVFGWMAERIAPPVLQRVPVQANENPSWRPPHMVHAWGFTAPIENIRFAGANRLCVNLGYKGTRRLIEPYSLRQTKDGNLVLFAIKVQTREDRFYRVDRIESAEITQQAFNPIYEIELSDVGPIIAPLQTRPSRSVPSPFSVPKPARPARITTGVRSLKGGPKYIFQCTACGKKFSRTSYDGTLKEHKNKRGYPCYGRFGTYVETKY